VDIHRQTGLIFAKDDVGPETFADPLKRQQLIELFSSLKGTLTVMKLDSSLVCGALNVPLLPKSFSREKAGYDKEVQAKRCQREAWAAGMDDNSRKSGNFPLNIVDSEHFTTMSVVRTYGSKAEAVDHAAAVVEGFLEVSQALDYSVDIVAEVSVYGNDFQRQLDHPIFGAFVKSLLIYARKGKLFIQGSMSGGRAVSDSIVPNLVTQPVLDTDGKMKALLEARQSSAFAGAEEGYHISEELSVYKSFGEAVRRVQEAFAERCPPAKYPRCSESARSS
jgi:hypothetical protein